MKKVIILLAVAVLAVSAIGVVEFSAVDNGDATFTISYTCTEGERPRGIALNFLTDGLTFDSVESWGCFNVCLDYAFDNSETYVVDDPSQTPVADPAGPGVGILGGTEVSLCVGYLDEDGDETLGEPGPDLCIDLITIAVSGSYGTITVSADTLRGPDSGVAGSGSDITSNLPISFEVNLYCCCFGDFNGSNTVTSTDISMIVNYWLANKNFLGIAPVDGPGYVQGMDLNESNSITSTDISLLVNHWLAEKNILGIAPCMPPVYRDSGNSATADETDCRGDFNDSGGITSTDITLLVNYWLTNKNILGIAPLDGPGYIDGMDLNESGGVTSTDINMIVSYWLRHKNIPEPFNICIPDGYFD